MSVTIANPSPSPNPNPLHSAYSGPWLQQTNTLSTALQNYSLWQSAHDRLIQAHTGHLTDSNFTIRQDAYWQFNFYSASA